MIQRLASRELTKIGESHSELKSGAKLVRFAILQSLRALAFERMMRRSTSGFDFFGLFDQQIDSVAGPWQLSIRTGSRSGPSRRTHHRGGQSAGAVEEIANPGITAQMDQGQRATWSWSPIRRFDNSSPHQQFTYGLFGHSYGGAVISSAGDDPKVVGLVYICAFAADTGDSVLSLIKTAPADAPAPPILPPQDGYLFLDRQKFAASFAADVKPEIADLMANSQVPWSLEAANGGATAAAWKTKPSWYLLTTDDHMIAPELQRFMSKRAGSKVTEIKGSHATYVSQPQAVAHLIEGAAAEALTVEKETAAGVAAY